MTTLSPLIEQIRSNPLINAHNAWAMARLAASLQPRLTPRRRVVAFSVGKLSEEIARLFDDAVEASTVSQLQLCSECIEQALVAASTSGGQSWVESCAQAISALQTMQR